MTDIKKILKLWEEGAIALTKPNLLKLQKARQKARDECKHTGKVDLLKGTWTDSGYGLDRHWTGYSIFCHDCNRKILTEIDSGSWVILANVSLEEAARKLQEIDPHSNLLKSSLLRNYF